MALDPNIILSGVGPDVVGSMSRGNALAGEILGQRRNVALNNLYQTQGADILAGKQPALNALAGLDPVAALGVQQTQQQIGFSAEEMAIKRAEIARMTSERAASLSAEEAAQHAAQIERGVAAATAATSPQQWDQIVTQFGAQDLVGQFGNKDAIINSYLGVAEGLKRITPTVPEVSIPSGYIPVDPNNPRAGVQLLPGYTPKSGPDVVVNNGEGNTFYKELDKGQAGMFQGLIDQGIQAGRNTVLVDRIGAMLEQTPTGIGAVAKNIAGSLGIPTDGLDEVQALNALVNQLTPGQRQPGSGSMSDKDIEMFKASLPSLINQPGGNAIILSTMRAIADYTLKQSEIANRVADRTITPAEGRKQLAALANPLSNVTGTGKSTPGAFSSMTLDQLNQVDIMQLDPAGLDEFEARYNALKGGN